MAVLRLALFVALAWSVYSLAREFTFPFLLLSLLLAGAFIACVNLHFRWKDKRILQEKLRFVSTNELAVLAGEPNGFPDGSSYLDSDNYLDDLDIFGRQSLFHLLNRTTTTRGSAALAVRLRQPLLTAESIVNEQEAIRILARQPLIRHQLTATGLVTQEKGDFDTNNLGKWLHTPPRLYNRILLRILILLLSAFNLYAFYEFFASNNYTLVIIGLVVARLIWGVFAKYIGQQHQLLGRQHALLDQFAGILAVFNKTDTADSRVLQELQTQTARAHTAIRRLSRLSGAFDQRLNLLVNLVLNNFFFYDLQCMIALERWKGANRNDLLTWIDAVSTVESLSSLATYAFNNPNNNYPLPIVPAPAPDGAASAPTLLIEASRLAHPLIPAARSIANDLTIGRDERLILVTGSNMSGKTTFLRTLGVNLLMAQCGLPVCAASFRFTPMQLLTSLRISDSLQEQTSYFMAELKKLQKIIHRLQTGAPALVLIDEILRGTNSEDKTFGSEQFIRKLLQYPCLALFATHDLSLGQLEEELPKAIHNYCFESIIEDNELHFDYRLQRGIARNRNASFLMQKMDII